VFLINNPDSITPSNLAIIYAVILMGISILIVNTVSFLIIDLWLVHNNHKRPSTLLRTLVAIFLYIPCLFIIFPLLGKDITMLAATSVVFSAVVGFALQAPLGNFLSGVFLQLDQPFQLGDRVEIEGYKGVIKTIGWRSIGIDLDSDEIIYIPNCKVADSCIMVATANNPIFRYLDFTAPATASPHQVMKTVKKAIEQQPIRNVAVSEAVFIRMWNYGSGDITYRLFYHPINYNHAEKHTEPKLRRRIWYALGRAGFGNQYLSSTAVQIPPLVANIEFFQHLDATAQQTLIENSKPLGFDAGERLSCDSLPAETLFMVVRGCLVVDQPIVEGLTKKLTLWPKASPRVALKTKQVESVAKRLAYYLGPSAFSLTYQTAKTVVDPYWIYHKLATEIANVDDRADFLAAQPKDPTELLTRGDLFGEMTLFLGVALPTTQIVASEETELLAISVPAISAALARDRESLKVLSCRVAEHYDTYLYNTRQAISPQPADKQSLAKRIFTRLDKLF
jgi:small-conductance mechanosensitive channel/CRP-like cAMP-binding protein